MNGMGDEWEVTNVTMKTLFIGTMSPRSINYSHVAIFSTTYVKLKSHLSVCLTRCHIEISAVSALIELRVSQNES